jgi:ribosomal protein S18 acetylase RimI-like enzyme
MSGVDLAFRRAAPGDLEAVTTLQHAAWAPNRPILGVEPIPLLADYAEILARDEVWLAHLGGALAGVLILQPGPDDMLIWSVAADPALQGKGIGNRLLALAEAKARAAGLSVMRLYTGQKLTRNVDWYARHGYEVERLEPLPDRTLVHMKKIIG